MAVLKSLLPLLIATLSLSSLCFQHASAEDFDFFTLALHRTATVCGQTACCIETTPPEFTIRGLWSDYNNGSWSTCCPGFTFEISELFFIIQELEEFWPSLSCKPYTSCNGGEDALVWRREWEKYGTCASPVLNDTYSYFHKAIELYLQYDVDQILGKAGIGSNELKYTLENVIATIENSVGASPIVICQNNSLKEVRLCFDKDFTPRTCGTVKSYSCPEYITVPIVGSSVNGGRNAANKKAFNPITLNVA